jgi:hypothetical protein
MSLRMKAPSASMKLTKSEPLFEAASKPRLRASDFPTFRGSLITWILEELKAETAGKVASIEQSSTDTHFKLVDAKSSSQ